ncbi:hypothetical protein MaudCBS49596_000712 [Microsporum audouinii]
MRVTSLFVANLLVTLAATASTFLNGIFTIFDDSNGDKFGIGTSGPLLGLIEIRPNATTQWFIEPVPGSASQVIIRDPESNKYISFPGLKDGATATLTETTPTVITISPVGNLRFQFTSGLVCTIERHSTVDLRWVWRLRGNPDRPYKRKLISMLGKPSPQPSEHE